MYLAPADAQRFIQSYKLLMLEVLGEQEDRINGSIVPLLAKLVGEPALLRKSIVLSNWGQVLQSNIFRL